MAASLKDIKGHMKGYRQSDAAARDVQSLLQFYKDLKIGSDQYIYPEGRREHLFRLKGTIPVSFKGATYNIPILIWLQKTHPQHNPIPYVTPTSDMSINPSRFVDASGRIYLPYITEWKQSTSDLSTLVQILCATFAESIPVYKKQQIQSTGFVQPPMSGGMPRGGYRPPEPSYPSNPYPGGYPGGGGPPGGRMPYPQPSYGSGRPPYPTPYSNAGQPTPMPMPGGGGYGGAPYPGGAAGGGYPPPGQPSYPPGGLYGPPVHNSPQPLQPQITAEEEQRRIQEERQRAEDEERQRREAERMSLETAVEDKIKRQLQSVLERAQDEMSSLEKTQKSLKDNQTTLTTVLTDMDTKQAKIESSIETLKLKTAELSSIIDQLESQPDEVNPDEAVCASSVVHNQILNLYAEETAIEDVLYYLGEALRKEVITHEVFLKTVRDLSRKQFMIRATIMKARDIAKLPAHVITA